MKNTLVIRSRIGIIIPRTSWLYSDPAIATPARNAPSDEETPASDRIQATPIQIVITEMMKSSRFLRDATTSRIRGTTTSATPSTTTRATRLVPKDVTDDIISPPTPAITGSSSMMGITAMS